MKSLANTHVNFLLLRLIQGYTKKMNAALEKMAAAMDDSSNSTIEGLMSSLSSLGADPDTSLAFQNNGGGFLNHKMYFATMSPDGQRTPTSDSALEKAIVASFGSFDKFKVSPLSPLFSFQLLFLLVLSLSRVVVYCAATLTNLFFFSYVLLRRR